MKSYHVSYGGGLDSLVLKEHAQPEPGRGQVLVKVRASSLNYREISILKGDYPLPIKDDVVAVSDGAGEVYAIGEGVTRVKKGDRVAVQIFPKWIAGAFAWEYADQVGGSLDGMLTEYALVSEEAVVHIPEHLSYEEAATLPCAALTAWNGVMEGNVLKPGDTILTLGSGSVSLFAIQFAKMAGYRVIATTSDDQKGEQLKVLGADGIVNYKKYPEWHKEVRKLTDGRGVDKVIEIGSNTFSSTLASLAIYGQISLVGRIAGGLSLPRVKQDTVNIQPVAPNNYNLDTLFAVGGSIRTVVAGSRAMFREMNKAISFHKMTPVIDRVFPFSDARGAYEYYLKGKYFGKIVISVD